MYDEEGNFILIEEDLPSVAFLKENGLWPPPPEAMIEENRIKNSKKRKK